MDGDDLTRATRFAGTIGLGATLVLLVVLGVHPFGTTELYDDGGRFLDHVNGFWIVLHFVAALVLCAYPLVIDVWARNLVDVRARVVGRGATLVATLGMAIGVMHLIATDTMVFVFFEDTYRAGADSEAVTTSADLLLRLHGSTLTAWVLAFWFAVPALLATASRLEPSLPDWFSGLAGLAAVLQVAALAVTVGAGQWTTVSEMGLFRVGATLLIVFFLLQTLAMRRGAVEEVTPRQFSRSA